MKILGDISTFLGIKATPLPNSFSLHQTNCAQDILRCVGMENCSPITTLMTFKHSDKIKDLEPYTNLMLYQQLFGALQYLTITIPDITFAVNQLCQHMHKSLNTHFQQLKCVLWYIKAMSTHGLLIQPTDLTVLAYNDSNWARDKSDCKSTNRHCILLGSTHISWVAKKKVKVARSSTKVEYHALTATTTKITWIHNFLVNFQI